MELFAFPRRMSSNCFQPLTSVSGVKGSKVALSILSAATPESLAMSIITGDEKADGGPGHREKSPSASSWS